MIHRGELLAELCAQRRLLAIAGTHGKTTTTAMCVWALREIGADPAFFLGGELPGAGPDGAAANAGWGEGEWVVAEADESDASFLELQARDRRDHQPRARPPLALGLARGALAGLRRLCVAASGVVCGSEVRLPDARVSASYASRWSPPASRLRRRVDRGRIRRAGRGSRFQAAARNRRRGPLQVPGRHNVANALAALGGARRWPASTPEACAEALAGFPGVARRLELKGERNGARIYDDYAHHPTEVAAALAGGARARSPPR